jgi:hypothetical protein
MIQKEDADKMAVILSEWVQERIERRLRRVYV